MNSLATVFKAMAPRVASIASEICGYVIREVWPWPGPPHHNDDSNSQFLPFTHISTQLFETFSHMAK